MATIQTLNIALLDTDIPVPAVLSTRGLYSAIFQQLLESALVRLSKSNLLADQSVPKVTFVAYNVVRGDYPPDPSCLDAVVISGSVSSCYDSDPWIATLHTWIRTTYAAHPSLKFFGSCFGHQILCSALLSPRDGSPPDEDVVVRNPAGWELGVLGVALSPAFLQRFPVDACALPSSSSSAPPHARSKQLGEPPTMRLQFVHADHVVLPRGLDAERWCVLGSTPRCPVQGVYERRVLTLQGHFEFDRFVNGETIRVFGAGWGKEALEEALRAVDADDDAGWAAEVVMAFLMGLGDKGGMGRRVVGAGGAVVEGGLMTPPGEM